jgi:hypothetical protein
MTRNRTTLLTLFASAAIALAAPVVAQAQGARYPNRGASLSRTSYDRMRQFARELDERARAANDQARRDQSDQYRRDTKFLNEVDQFARRAAQFRQRMDSYQTRPWNLDEELARLTEEARQVQYRIRRARFADARTRQDWDRVVALLSRMTSEYRSGGLRADRNDPSDRIGGWDRDSDFRYPNGNGTRYPDQEYEGYEAQDVRQLALELEQRAYRTAEMTRSQVPFGYGYGDALGRFANGARQLRSNLDEGRMTRQQLRSTVERLADEAGQAQRDLSRPGISREVRAEWDGVMRTLSQIREAAAA